MHTVRIAIRRLIRNKTYSVVIILSLALGIGANTATFGVINTLLLRPLPVKDVDRVVFTLDMREDFDPFGVAFLDAAAFKNNARSFSMIGWGRAQIFRLLGMERPERLAGAAISSEYLRTLGIDARLGRIFLPEDDRPEASPVCLISHSFWQNFFGGDEHILGRSLNLDNRDYIIVGVLKEGFDLPESTKVWVPLATNIEALPLEQQAAHANFLLARLNPGVSVEQANREAREIAGQLARDYPQWRKNWGIKLIPLRQQLIGDTDGNIRPTLFLLMAIVGFLLLITCANVASLLLARSVERSHETAIQVALGASRRQLIGQLLTESILLSLIGGAIGLVFAKLIATSMMSLQPVYFYTMKDVFQNVPIDRRVLGFTFLISLFAGVIFGLVPATRTVVTGNIADNLKEGGQRASGGITGRRLFGLLMVGEIAVAMVLVMGASLMVKSFQKLTDAKLGFAPDHLLTLQMTLLESDYPRHVQRAAFVKELIEKVKSLPGVTSAGVTTNTPLSVPSVDAPFTVEGKHQVDSAEVPITAHRLVSPEYLQALGVNLLQGRLIEEQDQPNSLPVVVVSKEFAARAWPGEDPIGKRVRRTSTPLPWYTVVGVVDDVKEDRFNFRIDRPVWYIPYVQLDNRLAVNLLVRTSVDPTSLASAIRRVIGEINHYQPISEATTIEEEVRGLLGPQRFTALLSGLFAGLGLFLAALGICGVTAYTVMQRTREFCVRLAFGARWADLVRIVLGRGSWLALSGLVIGLAGGLSLGRVLSSLLYQVSPTAPDTMIVPALLLLLVILMAMCLPMIRVAKLEPMEGLRTE